ncbi:MAG TPA: SdrD B-like domain-containing protein, partial [Pirellulaceae bacterium]|nr:SdrD B-like domain-containing protein [Pirellulaceae bacterium]
LFEPLEQRLLLTRNFVEVEPVNDTFPGQTVEHFSTSEVGVVDSATLRFGSLVAAITDGDQDFFNATQAVDGDLNVSVINLGGDPSSDGADDDLQVRVLNNVGGTTATLALSDIGDTQSFEITAGSAGDAVRFVVEGASATNDAEDQVRLTNVDREDNSGNNNSRSNATDLGAVSTIASADLLGYTITFPDRDYFKITADMDGPITVNVVMPTGSGAAIGSSGPTNLGLRIRNASGGLIATSGGTQTDVDSASFEATDGEMYFIEVYSGSRGQVNRYDLQIIKEGGDLSGYKFEDLNGDGLWGPDEDPLVGWTINLDLGDDGSVDLSTTTDANGFYQFTGVPLGTHQVTENLQNSFTQSLPGPDENFEYIVTVSTHNLVWDHLDFGNVPGSSIHGRKFEDLNADGDRDPGEPYLNGWTVILFDGAGNPVDSSVTMDMELDGQPGINGVTITLTGIDGMGGIVTLTQTTMGMDLDQSGAIDPDEQGLYWFTGLKPGTYTVTETVPAGWVASTPTSINLGALISGTRSELNDFGNYLPASVHGLKFEDLNGNGVLDAGESGVADVTITVTGIDGMGGQVSQTTATMQDDPNTPNVDETGMYWIDCLKPGTYTVSETVPGGWRARPNR